MNKYGVTMDLLAKLHLQPETKDLESFVKRFKSSPQYSLFADDAKSAKKILDDAVLDYSRSGAIEQIEKARQALLDQSAKTGIDLSKQIQALDAKSYALLTGQQVGKGVNPTAALGQAQIAQENRQASTQQGQENVSRFNQMLANASKIVPGITSNLSTKFAKLPTALQIKTLAMIDSVQSKFSKMVSNIGDFFKDTWSDAISDMKEMATYSSGSIFYNSEATSMRLNYGLSDAEAYAAQAALQQTGIGSMDTLLSGTVSSSQMEYFQKVAEQYYERYNDLADQGFFDQVQEFQASWAEFKQDIETEFMTFFMENKDTIMWTLKTGVELLSGIMTVIKGILSFFEVGSSSASLMASDTMSKYTNLTTTNSSMTSNTVNINNTFSNNAPTTASTNSLNSALSQTGQQIIRYLNG